MAQLRIFLSYGAVPTTDFHQHQISMHKHAKYFGTWYPAAKTLNISANSSHSERLCIYALHGARSVQMLLILLLFWLAS